jgi:hypothetical protein
MSQAGARQMTITATTFVISQGAVSKILKRHRERGVPTPKPRSGRPRKTTAREDRYLLRLCHNNRLKTVSQLPTMWIRFTNTHSQQDLWTTDFLVLAGYFARRPLRKPLLRQRHRLATFAWAEQCLNWSVGHWQHVIFSDESPFLLYRNDGRIRVRRQVHEALTDQTVLARVQAGGGGVTV